MSSPEARLAKLAEHERWAHVAAKWLSDWLLSEPELIAACARGRHAEGSIRFGDSLMYEYTQPELQAEALEELADAVNYISLMLSRKHDAR